MSQFLPQRTLSAILNLPILLTCLYTFSAQAGLAKSICASLLDKAGITQIQKDAAKSLLTFETANKLREQLSVETGAIFANEKLSAQQKAARSFEVYLRLRLALLTPAQASNIRDLIEQRLSAKTCDGTIGTFDCSYDPDQRSITVTVPNLLSETVLDYKIRVHEVEHAIQYLIASPRLGFNHPGYFFIHRFTEEKGAMTAEAAFIQSIPSDHLQDLFLKISNGKNIDKIQRKYFKSVLSAALNTQDTESYVRSQWSAVRYSRAQMAFCQAAVYFPAAFVGGLALLDLLLKNLK